MTLKNSQIHFDIKVRQVTWKSFAMSTDGMSVVMAELPLRYGTILPSHRGGPGARKLKKITRTVKTEGRVCKPPTVPKMSVLLTILNAVSAGLLFRFIRRGSKVSLFPTPGGQGGQEAFFGCGYVHHAEVRRTPLCGTAGAPAPFSQPSSQTVSALVAP